MTADLSGFQFSTDDVPPHAAIFGARGGIGSALADAVEASGVFAAVHRFSRSSSPAVDLLDEDSIAAAAESLKQAGPLRLVIDATGFLSNETYQPEKTWRHLDPEHAAYCFAINATGPALLMKHVLPLLPQAGKSCFATLSAKVGSITDNGFGGWWSYRASKAALNQFVKTASIELRRQKPDAVCLALHPGTVASKLSEPFGKDGLTVRPPEEAAPMILSVIGSKTANDTGGFFDYRGDTIPW